MERDKIYYFSDAEFQLLLSIVKRENWLGMNRIVSLTEEEWMDWANEITVSLYKKEVIEMTESKFRFVEPFRTMMHILQDTKYYFVAKKNEGDSSLITFYCANQHVLIVERRNQDSNGLRTQIMEIASFMEYLLDGLFFPMVVDESFEGEENPLFLKKDANLNILEISEMENVSSVFEKYTINSDSIMERIVVEDCILSGQAYLQRDDTERFMISNKEGLEKIQKWIEGDE